MIWTSLIAGTTARLTAAIFLCPIDTIKTRLQFQGHLATPRRYAGILDAFASIVREEGWRGFLPGLSLRIGYTVPAAGINFLFYEATTHYLNGGGGAPEPRSPGRLLFFSASASLFVALRVASSVVRTPFDVVRKRLQVERIDPSLAAAAPRERHPLPRSAHLITAIVQTEGVARLFSSAKIALVHDLPQALLYFATYEEAKRAQRLAFDDVSAVSSFFSGAIAATVSTVVMNPIDVVRTRIQGQSAANLHHYNYEVTSVMATLRAIFRREGARGLYAGVLAKLSYVAPTAAIVWGSYEFYKRALIGAFAW